jgi:hypothetical protein
LTGNEQEILQKHCAQKNVEHMTREEFINDVFYPVVYKERALCVGFNLAFDLTRIARHIGTGIKQNRDAFSLELSTFKQHPRIMLEHHNNLTFIRFGGSFNYFKKQNVRYFPGNFLDVGNLACILSNMKRLTLRQAGELFNASILKVEADDHGKVTPAYIDYCRQDVSATYALYEQVMKEYDAYDIDLDVCAAFSSATLGKAALRQLGVKPHNLQEPGFDPHMKEALMSAYYGGRCELRYRKTSVCVTTLDFLSMYPTLSTLMKLWRYVTAKRIIQKRVSPKSVEQLIKGLTLERLTEKNLWPKLCMLVKIRPDGDCLPVRKAYKVDSKIPNIGINYLTFKGELWYALPDVIASYLVTGKVPQIVTAIAFLPTGQQDSLRPAKILGMTIDPRKEDFIQRVIEERQQIKQRLTLERDAQKARFLDAKQKALKILANSTTYGIFVEMNRKDEHTELLNLIDDSDLEVDVFEEEGEFFNPLIAVMQIAGARLFLMMAEQKVKQLGGKHIYMDTDSIFVPPPLAKPLQEYFQPLNPYRFKANVLKIEKENLWFYGISSKRYVLYNYDDEKLTIYETADDRGYMLHGLGHLKDPFNRTDDWHKEIWHDLLELHYGDVTEDDLAEKYTHYYAVSGMTISTPDLWKRFDKYNYRKLWREQLKPCNFFLIGVRANGVKPVAPYCKNSQEAVYGEFIDYELGNVFQGEEYWGDLWSIIKRYKDHPESKFDGDTGWLHRKHLVIDGATRIGKEVHDIDRQALNITYPATISTTKENTARILHMTEAEAAAKGVQESIFYKIKRDIRAGKKINWKRTAIRKLLSS